MATREAIKLLIRSFETKYAVYFSCRQFVFLISRISQFASSYLSNEIRYTKTVSSFRFTLDTEFLVNFTASPADLGMQLAFCGFF
jgi:hypothetical protein